jgi:hypothetical protein
MEYIMHLSVSVIVALQYGESEEYGESESNEWDSERKERKSKAWHTVQYGDRKKEAPNKGKNAW